ncbi:putative terminase large subunit [Bacillus phage SP-15]|uniref:Putative terminase large subunit n=1 Tax=Bacillus phage SP-15 TaxID=1792032 RepID=A0A127AVZ1_9CAUD|nr:putative terminase large subunit [Bacillus phage SP-15]AMM44825.1 putative terminase large subunit [Bacillus phage SP-15]
MKVTYVKKLDGEHKVYDVVNAGPYNNFVIQPNGTTTSNGVVVHNCGLLDEVEFVAGGNAKMEQSKIMQLYRTIKRRMESRYMKMGELPGILFLVSSKKSDHDFLEQYIQQVRTNPNVHVVDQPLWKVKPKSNYSGNFFLLAVGNKVLPSKIIAEHENKDDYIEQGYRVIEVPVEHKQAFELDISAALMDIAGIAMASTSKYIHYDKLMKVISKHRENPFRMDQIVLEFNGPEEIADYMDLSKIHEEDLSSPCFIHIDPSLSGDSTGIAMTTIKGAGSVERLVRGEIQRVNDLVYKMVFGVAIKAVAGSQIPFHKIRQFIYWLRDTLGANVQMVTADSFQSADMLQQLKLNGFETKVISVDRKREPYDMLRNSINEERIDILPQSILEDELVNLEEDKIKGKIDHPINGSKDIADALAGSVAAAAHHPIAVHMMNSGEDAMLIGSGSTEFEQLGNDSWVIEDDDIVDVYDDDALSKMSSHGSNGRVLDW